MEGGLLALLPTRRGHFAFASGHHGDLWLDLDALFRRPRALQPYTDALAELLRPYEPEVVCGPLVGGAYVAYTVAAALDVDFTWSSPPGHRMPVDRRRAAIVDDAINAGSAVAATATALPDVVAVGALLTLGAAPATLAGAPVERLATLDSALWPAPDCPLCAAGSPLDDPPS